MPTGTIQSIAQIAGLSMAGTVTRTADSQLAHEIALPAGTAGISENKTDADTGDVAPDAGHGLSTSDVVDG